MAPVTRFPCPGPCSEGDQSLKRYAEYTLPVATPSAIIPLLPGLPDHSPGAGLVPSHVNELALNPSCIRRALC